MVKLLTRCFRGFTVADIVSAESKMNDVEIASEAPISEALENKFGANVNNLIDEKDTQEARLDALDLLKTVAVNTTGGGGFPLATRTLAFTVAAGTTFIGRASIETTVLPVAGELDLEHTIEGIKVIVVQSGGITTPVGLTDDLAQEGVDNGLGGVAQIISSSVPIYADAGDKFFFTRTDSGSFFRIRGILIAE